MQNISLTTDDFISVTDTNIDNLLKHETDEEDEDYFCSDENFELSGS